eukprot:CAMPEP_0115544950 /NCGR_PEP_ID=MMETSP0271-20121206/92353_1 /TAXON_ID=71861 /ORGANISM="Scrippsiella trochoidea, Strain CCMP3099" /LENGTH=138 /DNA_ID=CAMNT_0002978283 /DNA_START=234 /DNA_END=650 /DNA_ORIENTATION=+
MRRALNRQRHAKIRSEHSAETRANHGQDYSSEADLHGHAQLADVHDRPHLLPPCIVHKRRLRDDLLDLVDELPFAKARKRPLRAAQQFCKLLHFQHTQRPLVDSIKHLRERSCLTDAVQHWRVGKPIVPVFGNLSGLA